MNATRGYADFGAGEQLSGSRLDADLAKMNDVRIFVQSPTATDRRLTWIARHCIRVPNAPGAVKALPVSAYYGPPVSFP